MNPPDRDPVSSDATDEDIDEDIALDDATRQRLADVDDTAAWQLERPVLRRAKQEQAESAPRVRPLTNLEIAPPSRQRYRQPVRRSLGELWSHLELLYTFVERDIKVRYKQAALGGFWAIAQPLMLMVVFTFVFGRIARVNTGGVPYPIFSFSALVPWGLFSGAVAYGTNAIIGNAGTIRKIWCPREIFALSAVASAMFDFVISMVILFGLVIVYAFSSSNVVFPSAAVLAVVPLVVVLLLYTTTLTLIVSAITVYFRDTRYAIPLLLQVWLYATPVAYQLKDIKRALGGLAGVYPYLNPLSPVIDGFRRALALGKWPEWGPIGWSTGIGVVVLALSYFWYKRIDGSFADVI